MAGEIQLNSTTMATESSGTITLSNVNSATNRTNLGLGSIATQAADSVSISGGNITGGTIGSGVVFPANHILKVKTAITDTLTTINTSGMQDVTGLTVDITPKLGNAILIFFSFRFSNSTSSNNGVQILRTNEGQSDVLDLGGSTVTNLGNVSGVSFMDTSFTYYDLPDTDQLINYKVQVQRGAGTLYINDRAVNGNERNGSIIVMEIAI